MRARVLDEEGGPAFGIFATAPSWYSGIQLGHANVSITGANPILIFAHDNASFHDYRLVVSPGSAYEMFIDGSLEHAGIMRNDSGLPNLV